MRFPLQNFALVIVLLLSLATSVSANSDAGFIENKGQWPSQVLFTAEIPGGMLFVERDRLLYSFTDLQYDHGTTQLHNRREIIHGHAFELKFENRNQNIHVVGQQALLTYYNYLNSDSSISGVRIYQSIEIQNIYPHIDLKLYLLGNSLKYDFNVRPKGKIDAIQLSYAGLDGISISDGDLHLKTSLGEVTEMRPYAYQETHHGKEKVACNFDFHKNKLRFNVDKNYDSTLTLVIDPHVVFSAYSGSRADNWGNTATYDDDGNLYSAGSAATSGYPVTTGAYQTSFHGGSWDIAIMKYDSEGKSLLFATYLGGNDSETPQTMVVNHKGELLIMGTTSSTNFPVTNGSTFMGGSNFEPMDGVPYRNGSDIFVTKLSADGKRLLGSTYVGGSKNDGVNFISGSFDTQGMEQSVLCKNYGDQFRGDIITDESDQVYIISNTTSADFKKHLNVFAGGSHDAVVVKLTSDLSAVQWSKYLGGSDTDTGFSIKIDSLSNIFVAGGTRSANFVGVNGYKTVKGNDIDGWIAQISNDGQTIYNATYLGTSAYDQIYFIDIGRNQEIYAFGQTQGNYPVTGNVFSQAGGGQFIHKLSHDLKNSLFSTTIGSGGNTPNISPTAFMVSDCSKIYLAGWGGGLNATTVRLGQGFFSQIITRNFVGGNTKGLRVSDDAYQNKTSGNDFYLMVLDADASAFLYATFLGGNESITHVDGGTSRFNKNGIVYHAVCAGCGGFSDFPAVNSPAGHGQNRAITGARCNNAAFKFDLTVLRAKLQTNSVELNAPGLDTICFPSPILFQNKSIGAKSFEWDFGDGTETLKSDSSSVTHTYKAPGVYKVVLTGYNSETCEGKDIATAVVSVFDPDTKVADDGTICEGGTYNLFASGGTSYTWSSSDGTFASTDASFTVNPIDSTAYYVSIGTNVGCSKKDTVTVNVIKVPEYKLSVISESDCWNRPPIRFKYSTKDTTYTYSWNVGDSTVYNNTSEFVHEYSADGVYNTIFTASNKFCSYEKIISVPVVTVKIPNVITVNEDAYNDQLVVEGPDPKNIDIFNRWGKMVYHSDSYQNNWSASGLPAGVYYYRVEIKDEATCKGWVQVIK